VNTVTKRKKKMTTKPGQLDASAKPEQTKFYLEIFPKYLSFGLVCQGFVYHLTLTLTNKGMKPTTIRLNCVPTNPADEKNKTRIIYEPKKIAPGMSTTIVIELIADYHLHSSFDFSIAQGLSDEVMRSPVTAFVVPVDIFKNIAKTLQLQKRPIYRNGVQPIRASLTFEDRSTTLSFLGGATPTNNTENLLSEALMDSEDVDDILELPILSNVYWDPHSKLLRMDKTLGGVDVNAEYSIDDTIFNTNKMRDQRMIELEDLGYYTLKTVRKLEENKQEVNVSIDEFDSSSMIRDSSIIRDSSVKATDSH